MSSSACLDRILGSVARARMLEALVDAPERGWAIREIATRAGIDYKSAWREMALLREQGLVVAEGAAGRTRYRWNRGHPAAASLEGLASELGETGPLRILRGHVAGLPWIREAILFGSWARGQHVSSSDIDLLIVGSTTTEEAHRTVESLERRLRHRVDCHVYDDGEFARLRAEPGSFVASVLAGPHVVLKAS